LSRADLVFGALADPTRRSILELLREREHMIAGEIADRFPRMSRPAVSKHLRVLREAGLVRSEERGREHRYALDARPLADLQRGWLEQFAPHWERSLEQLKEQAETRAGGAGGRPAQSDGCGGGRR
jgi:DNA-binding transcriptional ArsR family regulator